MAQPVYVVPRPEDDMDFLGGLFALPFFAGWLWVCAVVWDDLPTVHPVFRLMLIGAALITVLLGKLRTARSLYALTVVVVGTALIFQYAPDIIWKIFWEIPFLVGWGAIAYHFEKRQRENTSAPSPAAPTEQNTAPN